MPILGMSFSVIIRGTWVVHFQQKAVYASVNEMAVLHILDQAGHDRDFPCYFIEVGYVVVIMLNELDSDNLDTIYGTFVSNRHHCLQLR